MATKGSVANAAVCAPLARQQGSGRQGLNSSASYDVRHCQSLIGRAPERPRGVVKVRVAVVDGPYDFTALSTILAREPINLGDGSCRVSPSRACDHGTFIMGLLGARKDALLPGLCPDCDLLHVPLFVDKDVPRATVTELAKAITLAVSAGAQLINLSLAIVGDDAQRHRELTAALDYAEVSGAVVVVAAGNQGRLAMGQLLLHPVTIPVVAVDAAHRLLPGCNCGPLISRRGVAAQGYQVLGYAPAGGTTVMSGTSVATAVATGTLARLWSVRPNAAGAAVRAAVARLPSRMGSIPPMLDQEAILAALEKIDMATDPAASQLQGVEANYASLQGEMTMNLGNGLPRSLNAGTVAVAMPGQVVTPAQSTGGCACGAPGGVCTCEGAESSPPRFIYVLGTVDIRFPDQSISEELQDVARTANIAQGPNETLRSYYYRVLSLGMDTGVLKARHVARQVCWILTVEGLPAYYLTLRDLQDLPDLISCLGRSESDEDPLHHDDLDLFVGSSSLIRVNTCPGVAVPVLAVDQVCSFEKDDLVAWCRTPSKTRPSTRRRPPGSDERDSDELGPADKLFRILVQSADNLGDTDQWRALNYLAVRYKNIYMKYAEMADDYELISVNVATSRLSREKHIVDPVFAFQHRETGVVQKYFVRVDVSHLFPMIVNHIAEYFDR
jgi:hypothetical protein